MMASLLVSEAKAETLEQKSTVFMATLDSQKAFDVVHHSILIDKLFDKGINDTAWLVIKDLYQDISSKVKWVGDLSDSFPINQGVRQGAILSTHLYKIYIDELHSVLTICTQTGTCDTRSGDLVFFSAAFDEFSLFTKN